MSAWRQQLPQPVAGLFVTPTCLNFDKSLLGTAHQVAVAAATRRSHLRGFSHVSERSETILRRVVIERHRRWSPKLLFGYSNVPDGTFFFYVEIFSKTKIRYYQFLMNSVNLLSRPTHFFLQNKKNKRQSMLQYHHEASHGHGQLS